MKLFFSLFLLSILCSAQKKTKIDKQLFRLNFGVVQSFQFFKQFEIALEEYSQKREWLETKPNLSNSVSGLTVGGGVFNGNKAYYGFNLYTAIHNTIASGNSNYGFSEREFKVWNSALILDYLITNKFLMNKIYVGGSFKCCRLSFYSLSNFNNYGRINGSYLNLSPKISYLPSILKRRIFFDFQFNIPLNPINISTLNNDIGAVRTKQQMWPYSFDFSLKVLL